MTFSPLAGSERFLWGRRMAFGCLLGFPFWILGLPFPSQATLNQTSSKLLVKKPIVRVIPEIGYPKKIKTHLQRTIPYKL